MRPLYDLYVLQLRFNRLCSAYKVRKEKSLPGTPKVMRFCLSNELRQRSQDLLGLCIMQRFPQSRPQSRELLHPTRLPLKNELSSSSPMFEECSLRDACSALSGGSPQPSPSRTLEFIQQKFKAVGGKPTHPPSNFEVLPENVQAFLGKGQ